MESLSYFTSLYDNSTPQLFHKLLETPGPRRSSLRVFNVAADFSHAHDTFFFCASVKMSVRFKFYYCFLIKANDFAWSDELEYSNRGSFVSRKTTSKTSIFMRMAPTKSPTFAKISFVEPPFTGLAAVMPFFYRSDFSCSGN